MKRPARPPIGCLLLLLFTIVPALELTLLIWFTIETHILWTMALIILTGVIGAAVAKAQGVLVLYEAQRDMALGRFPAQPLFEGILLLVGGALLLTPGLLTDLVGLSVLVPPLRRFYAWWLQRNVGIYFRMGRPPGSQRAAGNGTPPPPGETREAGPEPPPEEQASPRGRSKQQSPFEDRSPFGRIRKRKE